MTSVLSDPRLPALSAALDPDAAGRMLSGARGLFAETVTLRSVRIVRVRYRPSKRASILYELDLDDARGRGPSPAWISATLYPGRKAHRRFEEQASAATGIAPAPLAPVALNAEAGLIAESFPFDRRLPRLASYFGGVPDELRQLLADRLGADPADVGIAAPVPVRYRPGISATLRYDAVARDRRDSVFVKLNAAMEPALTLRAEALRHVHSEDCTLNLPLAYLDDGLTTVTRHAAGIALSDNLAADCEPAALASRMARAIAMLHTLRPPVIMPRSGAGALGRAARNGELIGQAWPDLRAAADDVCRFACADTAASGSAILHGDLKPAHMFDAGRSLELIDLDDAGRGDPAEDIAALSVRLRTGLELAAVPAARRTRAMLAFLDTYRRMAPPLDPIALRQRLAAHYLDSGRFAIEHVLPDARRHVEQALSLAVRLIGTPSPSVPGWRNASQGRQSCAV